VNTKPTNRTKYRLKLGPWTVPVIPTRCAGLPACRIAGFQIGIARLGQTIWPGARPASWETRDTTDLEVVATSPRQTEIGPAGNALHLHDFRLVESSTAPVSRDPKSGEFITKSRQSRQSRHQSSHCPLSGRKPTLDVGRSMLGVGCFPIQANQGIQGSSAGAQSIALRVPAPVGWTHLPRLEFGLQPNPAPPTENRTLETGNFMANQGIQGTRSDMAPPFENRSRSGIRWLSYMSASGEVSGRARPRPCPKLPCCPRLFSQSLPMPTILRVNGYQFYFYAEEGNEPPHIHVAKGGFDAKFWLSPARLAVNHGFRPHDLREIANIIEQHEDLILDKWHEFF